MTAPTERPIDDLVAQELDRLYRLLESEPVAGGATVEVAPLPEEARSRVDRAKECLNLLLGAARARRATANGNGSDTHLDAPAESTIRLPEKIGRFLVQSQLGSGGFGIVYLAHDPLTRRQVAIKIPKLEALASRESRLRFEVEAAAAAKLDHVNVVSVLEAGLAGVLPYMASLYYPAPTLATWLDQHPEPVSPREAAKWIRQLALGVQHAHDRGVLHRDIKPSNVLMTTAADGSLVPKLTDFGLAKLAEGSDELTKSGALIGTLKYMAPEQATGNIGAIGRHSDVYALGTLLYEILTRHPPFEGPTELEILRKIEEADPPSIRRQRQQCPADLEIICKKCLEKEPHRRYGSAGDLAEDLGRFLVGEPIRARQTGTFERTVKWSRRRPAVAGLILLSIVAVLTLSAVSGLYNLWLGRALEQSRRHENTAMERALEARLHAYAGSMILLSRDSQTMRFEDQVDLLEPYIPKEDEPDIRGFEWWLHWGRLRRDQSFRRIGAHSRGLNSVVIHPADALAATAGVDGVVRLWKLPEGTPAGELHSPSGAEINDLAFQCPGTHLAAALEDKTVAVWDLRTKGTPRILKGHTAWVAAVAFSPDGKIFATGGDKRIFLFDTGTWQKFAQLEGHTDTMRDLVFSPHRGLFSAAEDGTIRAWEVPESVPLPLWPNGMVGQFKDRWPRRLAITADGRSLIAIFNHMFPTSWKIIPATLGEFGDRLPMEASPRSVAFCTREGETRVIFGLENGTIVRTAFRNLERDQVRLLGHRGSAEALAVTSDGRQLISGDSKGEVFLWALSQQSKTIRHQLVTRGLKAALAPSGKYLIVQTKDEEKVLQVDCMTGLTCASWIVPPPDRDYAKPAFSADGKRFACTGDKNVLFVFSMDQRQPLATVKLELVPPALSLSPDGRWVAAASHDTTAVVDVSKRAIVRKIPATSSDGAIFLDADRLMTASRDGRLRTWNLETGDVVDTLAITDGPLYGLALSSDRRLIGVGGYCMAWIIDLAERKVLRRLAHKNDVHCLFFLARDATILTTDTHPKYRLWHLASGREVGDLTMFGIDDHDLSASADGFRLLASFGNFVSLFDATPFSLPGNSQPAQR